MAESELVVLRDDENSRYIITVDGDIAGFIAIRTPEPGRVTFVHTALIPSYRGRGLATVLAGRALEDAAARGETVTAVCPVVQHYARGHTVAGLAVEFAADSEG